MTGRHLEDAGQPGPEERAGRWLPDGGCALESSGCRSRCGRDA